MRSIYFSETAWTTLDKFSTIKHDEKLFSGIKRYFSHSPRLFIFADEEKEPVFYSYDRVATNATSSILFHPEFQKFKSSLQWLIFLSCEHLDWRNGVWYESGEVALNSSKNWTHWKSSKLEEIKWCMWTHAVGKVFSLQW